MKWIDAVRDTTRGEFFSRFVIVLFLVDIAALALISTQDVLTENLFWFQTALTWAGIALGVVLFLIHQSQVEELLSAPRTKPTRMNKRQALLLVLVLLCAAAVSFGVGIADHDFREDEFQVIDAAAGYAHNGTFYKWDWLRGESSQYTSVCLTDIHCLYTRAWPHTWLVAQSYKLFGISEFSSRLPSLVSGVLFVLILYLVTTYFTKRRTLGLLAAALIIVYQPFISMFQLTRMYAFMVPLFLIVVYTLYRGLVEPFPTTRIRLPRVINFHWGYLLLSATLLLLAVMLHINAFVIVPTAFLFIVYLALATREPKYILATTMGVIGIAIVAWLAITMPSLDSTFHFISAFTQSHMIYLTHLSAYPFSRSIGIVLLGTMMIASFFFKQAELRHRYMYLTCMLLFVLPFFITVADRYTSFNYIIHVVPVALILILSALSFVWRLMHSAVAKAFLVLLMIVQVISLWVQAYPAVYLDQNKYGKLSESYQVILDEWKPGQAVFSQYLRAYYLRELSEPGKNPTRIDLLSYKRYTYEQFVADLAAVDSGWIVWERRKEYHIRTSILQHIRQRLRHVRGAGLDSGNVEVYYFDASMK